ncbi:helicase DnaB [Romboutsia ilealis]|uniref:DNA 5'-3' helicase n=1 Tax=Romboutsia faecis TaxID=2764597 RepID=A0ABR7JLM9_9FIRM|nr:DnaB-like helicase C-terminal domain-containing protein [Romboutsia faecis]MBC5995818.1 AAA family ATPase [Romboutsia faecis]MRN23017.1 helicase DnaB [Romboutsia ilealis]
MSQLVSAIEIEQAFLGCILLDNSLSSKLDEIYEDCFYNNLNKEIYLSMVELLRENKTIDLVNVKTKLDGSEIKVEILYLLDLTSICRTYSIDSYIETLKEKADRRFIINKCQSLLKKVTVGEDLDLSIFNFENEMKKLVSDNKYNDDIVSISQSVLDLLEGNGSPKIKFGITFLDEVVGGLFKGELTTIAAKSGLGKTSFALQIMLNAVKQGKKILFITREMSKEQIIMRNITKKTGINTNRMKSNDISAEEWKIIIEVLSDLNKNNLIYINDKIHTVAQIRKRIREIKPDLLIVDYVQLMSPSTSMTNREREVASISRDLKNITLDFDMSVIQLSQLNDEMKDFRPRGDRPMRESKALFHDSNNVIYIHEPIDSDLDEICKKLGRTKESVLKANENGVKILEVIIAKCRDGEKRYKYFAYNGQRLHFQEMKENIGGYVC